MMIKDAKGKNWSSAEITLAARTAHEVNRAYSAAIGEVLQPEWDLAESWQRDSAIDGVLAIIENPDMTPKESHAGWLEHKQNDGWEWGAVKNPKIKQHPCMMPYEELPLRQRAKDSLFGTTVRSVLGIETGPSAKTQGETFTFRVELDDDVKDITDLLERHTAELCIFNKWQEMQR